MPKPLPRRAAANPTQYNVDAIAKLEHDALGRRTLTERVSDVITKLVGNTGFLLAQLLLICGWSLINLRGSSLLQRQICWTSTLRISWTSSTASGFRSNRVNSLQPSSLAAE